MIDAEMTAPLAEESLDELAAEIARLPEESEQAALYHDELIRRQQQADLDTATSQLVGERKRYSVWTILILGAGILAFVASMMLQK